MRPCSGWARREMRASFSSFATIWFIVCGVTKQRLASAAPDNPGSSSNTLNTAYCGVVSPSPRSTPSISTLRACSARFSWYPILPSRTSLVLKTSPCHLSVYKYYINTLIIQEVHGVHSGGFWWGHPDQRVHSGCGGSAAAGGPVGEGNRGGDGGEAGLRLGQRPQEP